MLRHPSGENALFRLRDVVVSRHGKARQADTIVIKSRLLRGLLANSDLWSDGEVILLSLLTFRSS